MEQILRSVVEVHSSIPEDGFTAGILGTERAGSTPDTVLTLVDGTKYLVSQSLTEVAGLIRQYRASVIAEAQRVAEPTNTPTLTSVDDSSQTVVPLHRRER